MIFVREGEEARWDTTLLEHVKGGEAFTVGKNGNVSWVCAINGEKGWRGCMS